MPIVCKVCGEDASLLPQPDPVVLELNRLQNLLKEKDREIGKACREIRALKAAEVLKDSAMEGLEREVKSLNEKLHVNENQREQKNLEIKKLMDARKEALAAQYAVESTLRRVYADRKDDNQVPVEAIVAPVEAELKILRHELVAAQEDKRALERHMKSKEAALIEAENILESAFERALMVEEFQSHNFELRRQIEICHEENKVLEKANRQKVLEVEKLSRTIQELEEAVLTGGAVANTIRDYRRQISELNEEKRTSQRELSRLKVSANRIATVMANDRKDDKDKVIPVKQWLEERRVLQVEIQKLKDKLAVSDRASRANAQVNEKLKLRLITLEDGLKHAPSFSPGSRRAFKSSRSDENLILSTIEGMLPANDSEKKKKPSKTLWASRSNNEKENKETNENSMIICEPCTMIEGDEGDICEGIKGSVANQDLVSGFLYDRLQKEVIQLRKACNMKDTALSSKEEQIKLLTRKISRVSEAVSKKMKREVFKSEKDSAPTQKGQPHSP